jgi:hypothetical protein
MVVYTIANSINILLFQICPVPQINQKELVSGDTHCQPSPSCSIAMHHSLTSEHTTHTMDSTMLHLTGENKKNNKNGIDMEYKTIIIMRG